MSPARIAEASEAFKMLDPIGVSLLDAVRDYLAGQKRRNASISFLDLFNLYLDAKKDKSEDYLKELRITRDRDELAELHNWLVCDIGARDLEPILNAMPPAARNAVM